MPAHSLKLTEIPRPFVCCVLLDDPTPDHVARTIKLAEYDGADAFDLELQGLDEAYRRPGALGRVFETATRPVFTVYRRYRLSGDRFDEQADLDAARMQLQLDLLDAGSVGFDMELDTFDPQPGPRQDTPEGRRYAYDRNSPPREVSTDAAAVERQMRADRGGPPAGRGGAGLGPRAHPPDAAGGGAPRPAGPGAWRGRGQDRPAVHVLRGRGGVFCLDGGPGA